jgi:hypothetical protein
MMNRSSSFTLQYLNSLFSCFRCTAAKKVITFLLSVSILMTCMIDVPSAMCEKQDDIVNLWVLLIGGCIEEIPYTPPNLEAGYQFLRDTYYMYWVANSCLSIPTSHIYYIYPDVFSQITDGKHHINKGGIVLPKQASTISFS